MGGSVNTGRTWCEPLEGITQSNESQTWYSCKIQGGPGVNL